MRTNIANNLNGTKTHLNKIYTDIGNTLDKIKTRETYLNKQLEPSLIEYRTLQVSVYYLNNYYIKRLIITYFRKSFQKSKSNTEISVAVLLNEQEFILN